MMPPSTRNCSIWGHSARKRSCSFGDAEPHHVFDAGAVVPAAIEDDDFAGGRKVLQVALHVHLGFLAVGWRRQRDDPEHARADALGERADRAALAGAVASLEHDDDAQALFLDPSCRWHSRTCSLRSSFSYFDRFIDEPPLGR